MKMRRFLMITMMATCFAVQMMSQPVQATDFTVTDNAGNTHTLEQYRTAGKYVLLTFFASDSDTCKRLIQQLNLVYTNFGCNASHLVLLGLTQETLSNGDLTNFANQNGCSYPLVAADGGAVDVFTNFQVDAVPKHALIRPDGSILWHSTSTNLLDINTLTTAGITRSACPDDWPVADFIGTPTTVVTGDSVTFENLTTNPASYWLWHFEGGNPNEFVGEIPPKIVYDTAGTFDVTLTVRNEFANENVITKNDYIVVYQDANEPPTADFTADRVTLIAGESTNFYDHSHNYIYEWAWTFDGASPETSIDINPQGITYSVPGDYDVQLIVRNSEGYDTLRRQNYIHVVANEGSLAPVANFFAPNRLVKVNTPVFFSDMSTNIPMYWNWIFEGGTPETSTDQLPPQGVTYSNTGRYDVTLTCGNANGADICTKPEYIVVYNAAIGKYCDTLTNMRAGEVPYAMTIIGMDGHLGGRNSRHISTYADFYDVYTFNQVNGVALSVMKVHAGTPKSFMTIAVWDGSNGVPTTVLGEQKIMLNDLHPNSLQVVTFDEPISVDGPFFIGFTLNDTAASASRDTIVVGLVPHRGHGQPNSLWLLDNDTWTTATAMFDINTATSLMPLSCLVGIDEATVNSHINVFPNPVSNELFVENQLLFNNGDFVEIIDNSGKIIARKFAQNDSNMLKINVLNLAQGTYHILIFTKGNIITQKINIVK